MVVHSKRRRCEREALAEPLLSHAPIETEYEEVDENLTCPRSNDRDESWVMSSDLKPQSEIRPLQKCKETQK